MSEDVGSGCSADKPRGRCASRFFSPLRGTFVFTVASAAVFAGLSISFTSPYGLMALWAIGAVTVPLLAGLWTLAAFAHRGHRWASLGLAVVFALLTVSFAYLVVDPREFWALRWMSVVLTGVALHGVFSSRCP